MNRLKVDYHIHTTYSDGHASPMDIIKKAKELEYDVLAITDHDNVDGIAEAMIAGQALDIKIVPGIEVATMTEEGVGLHILGYNIDPENVKLKNFLSQMIENRNKRNKELLRSLAELGYELKEEEIETGKNQYIGKPVIARALASKGYIKDYKEAFGPQILGSKKCRSIQRVKPLAKEAIEIIIEAGGQPVLAHPIQARGIGHTGSEEFYKNIEEIIAKLKKQGLKGLECFHPDQNQEQSMRFVELACKYHLHITEGSDFHGEDFAEAPKTANSL